MNYKKVITALTDRRGEKIVSVWLVYLIGMMPAIWGFYLGSTGGLGADPVKSFEHLLGIWALRFLILTLMLSPLRDITGVRLLRYRRALGLLSFYYALMHFGSYIILDQNLNLSAILHDIVRRPYITLGMGALIVMLPLALTSNRWSIRRLGSQWTRLHKLIYIVAVLGALHYILGTKVWLAEPIIYSVIIVFLLLWRVLKAFVIKKKPAQIRLR